MTTEAGSSTSRLGFQTRSTPFLYVSRGIILGAFPKVFCIGNCKQLAITNAMSGTFPPHGSCYQSVNWILLSLELGVTFYFDLVVIIVYM